MHTQTLLITLASLAAMVTADSHPAARLAQIQPGVVARADRADCTSSLKSVLSAIPQPTPALESAIVNFEATATVTGAALACAVTNAVPQSLQSAMTSYNDAVSSWWSGASSEVVALASSCVNDVAASSLTAQISALDAYQKGGCTGTAPATTIGTNYAPRETGAVAGAVVAAGLVVALL